MLMLDPYDVAVVGAGPGGSMAAFCLARAGHRVVLVDRSTFPRDKSCGDGLIRQSVELLAEMGLSDALLHGQRIDRLWLHANTSRPQGALRSGYCGSVVTRRSLDAAMLMRAESAGAEVRQGLRVTDLRHAAGSDCEIDACCGSNGVRLRARYVVGADGSTSLVARRAGLFRPDAEASGVARRGYFRVAGPLPPAFHIHFPLPLGCDVRRFAGYGWVFPVDARTANIGVGLFRVGGGRRFPSLPHLLDAFVDLLRREPALRDLELAEPATGGLLPSAGVWSRCHDDCVLLVGDAAGLVDPFTGEGIYGAMRSGAIAAEVIDAALRGAGRVTTAAYGALLEREFGPRFYAGERFLRSYAVASRVIEEAMDRDARIFLAMRKAAFAFVDPAPAVPFEDLLARSGNRTCWSTADNVARVCGRFHASLQRVNPLLPKIVGDIADHDLVGERLAVFFAHHLTAGGKCDDRTVDAAAAVELCALAFAFHASVTEDAMPTGTAPGKGAADATNTFALMTGDGLLTEAYAILATLNDAVRVLVSDVAVVYCNAWLEQARLDQKGTLDPALNMVLCKGTAGALFGLAAQLGVMMAEGEGSPVARAGAIGAELGVVASLISDIRDALSDPDQDGSHPYATDAGTRAPPHPVLWARVSNPLDFEWSAKTVVPILLQRLRREGAVDATRALARERLAAVRTEIDAFEADGAPGPVTEVAMRMAARLDSEAWRAA